MKIPTGYRFAPTDEELISYYLARKLRGLSLPSDMIKVDLYDYTPEQLEVGYGARREQEMYFFTRNKLKYENGNRPTRGTCDGFWRASTRKISIKDDNGREIGHKMMLNYRINSDKNRNTKWLMYEYTIPSNSKKMDGDVLCKVYNKDSKQEVQFNAPLGEEPRQNMERQPQATHITANLPSQANLASLQRQDPDYYEDQNVHLLHQNSNSQTLIGDEEYNPLMKLEKAEVDELVDLITKFSKHANLHQQNRDTEGCQQQDLAYDGQSLRRQVHQNMEAEDNQNWEPQIKETYTDRLQQQDPAYESASAHVGLQNKNVDVEDDLFTAEELALTEGVYNATWMEDELNIQPDAAVTLVLD
ncbi:hypothetical protein TIFTF001_008187 [Ficus carica]|uniref:NAC domain-containing protein n=1 Tax=Ficus carica TaxID=3494 RepID=A0AA88D0C0_FICCA|nr:hypothetical protein TIFTF001_008187 [Ficus carica]